MIKQINATITVVYSMATGEDEYGNPLWVHREEDHKVLLAWGATGTDYGVERNILTTQATLYFPETVSIPLSSVILINGSRFVLDGEQVTWNAPAGWSIQAGSIVQVKKAEG